MSKIKPEEIIQETVLRRKDTTIFYGANEQVDRIVHHYEDGSRREIVAPELDEIAFGEKTWKQIARKLGKALDGEDVNG